MSKHGHVDSYLNEFFFQNQHVVLREKNYFTFSDVILKIKLGELDLDSWSKYAVKIAQANCMRGLHKFICGSW